METKRRLRGGATVELQGWAQENRNTPTEAEEILWEALRGRQLNGLRFRFQHSYAVFIFDFYCPSHKLIIEVDGGYHHEPEQAQHDTERDSYLLKLGFRTLRLTNDDVLHRLPTTLKKSERPQPHSSPTCGGQGARRNTVLSSLGLAFTWV